jgi:5'-nucleotidase
MAEFADSDAGLPVDSTQHAVGVTFPADAPAAYLPGDTVAFDLSSLAFTSPADQHDGSVTVSLGGKVLGSFDVDNTVGTDDTTTPLDESLFDEWGTASVSAKLPAGVTGRQVLTVTGDTTGTEVEVPVRIAKTESAMSVFRVPGHVVVNRTHPRVKVDVMSGGAPAIGVVKAFTGGHAYRAVLNKHGRTTITLDPFTKVGKHRVRVKYFGSDTARPTTQFVNIWVHRR